MQPLIKFSFSQEKDSEHSLQLPNMSMFTETGLLPHAVILYTPYVEDQ